VRSENVTGAHADRPSYRYRICVRGRLGETIRSAFPALQAQASGGDTVLTGPLPDRAALYGVLAQIEALGLELLEVRRLPPGLTPRPGPIAQVRTGLPGKTASPPIAQAASIATAA
jgi:hypothetical protein